MFVLRCLVIFISLHTWAMAQTGVGAVADNMLGPVFVFSNFVNTACLLIGGSFLIASVLKYMEHRRSPLMVPISTVIFLVVAGLFLVLLPFLSTYSQSGIPFTLWNQNADGV